MHLSIFFPQSTQRGIYTDCSTGWLLCKHFPVGKNAAKNTHSDLVFTNWSIKAIETPMDERSETWTLWEFFNLSIIQVSCFIPHTKPVKVRIKVLSVYWGSIKIEMYYNGTGN